MKVLKPNQKLVYAGTAELRAPNGTPLQSVPQYMIVSETVAEPSRVVELHPNECLVVAGSLNTNRKSAKERFADLKSGREAKSDDDSIPLYIKESLDNMNVKTRLSNVEEEVCDLLIGDLVSEFSRQMRKLKSLERQEDTGS